MSKRKSDEFLLVIDYSQGLSEMIKAGKYNWFDKDITDKHFPVTGKGNVSYQSVLVSFDRGISPQDAVHELEKKELKPAKIEHLLAYGAQHWKYDPAQVVALGSFSLKSISGRRRFPHLFGFRGRRRLCLDMWHDDLIYDIPLLAVRLLTAGIN